MKSLLYLGLAAAVLVGCSKDLFISKSGQPSDVQDLQQGLTRQDYRDMNKTEVLLPEDAEASVQLGAPPVPDLAQVLAAPRPPKLANSKLVTISVTDDVSLRDVLFELGRLADVDIEVGSGLDQQGVNLRATDRPFNEVIERISDLAGLRYSVSGKTIRIERDTPYIKNYPVDFINIVRSSTSNYSLSTSVLSSGTSGSSGGAGGSAGGSGGGSASGGGGVGTSGSTSSISATAESDLWSSLEASLQEILSYAPPVATRTGGDAAAGAGGVAVASPNAGGTGNIVVNRQAGLISVSATERQHEMVQRYLTLIQRSVSAQVLIEAKIVEVSLRDQFLSGVDWNGVLGNLNGAYIDGGTWNPIGTTDFTLGNNGAVTFGIDSGDLNAVINLTERFGTTRTLSSPRLSAINNQQAVLTFAENRIFFDCSIPEGESTTDTGGSVTTTGAAIECTTNSVPIGIILSILPSINLDTQEVTLSVRPTLTRQVDEVENPGVRIAAAAVDIDDLTSTVPVIEVREIDSVMKVRSGGVMVIGGLMEDSSATENRGIPGASEVPFIGSIFKSRDEDYRKRELIIFIKASIVTSDGNTHPFDRSFYKTYTTDPRPAFKQTPKAK